MSYTIGPGEKPKLSVFLFCIAFFAYGLIFSGFNNWNTTSRISLSVSIADQGSLYIDDFAALTGDKSKVGDHFVSDKAPGLSFLALPAVAAAIKIVRLFEDDAQWVRQDDDGTSYPTSHLRWVLWFATLTTSSFYTALGVVALFRIALLLRVTVQGALFAAMIYGFATPTWAWATTFFGHATCGAFLVLGLWLVIVASTSQSKIKSCGAGLAAGFLLGTAIVVEYTSAPAALFIAIYGVWRSLALSPERTLSAFGSAIVGALIAGIPLMLYNRALFGSGFSVSYSYEVGWANEFKEGFLGFGWPKPLIALRLLFSPERGLLWLAPILALAPMACWSMSRAGEKALMVLCLAVFLSFLSINSAFVGWWAGAATGPRYLTPSLPFIALPFAWLWDASGLIFRRVIAGMAILSGIACFAMAAVQPFAQVAGRNVVLDILLPKLATAQTPNLVARKVGLSSSLALASYIVVIGGGIIILLRFAESTTRSRVPSSASLTR